MRALLGLPDEVPLRWTRDGATHDGTFGVLDLQIQLSSVDLRLELCDGGRPTLRPWLEGGGMELRIAPPVGDRDVITALAKRLGGRFVRNVDAGVRAALREELAGPGGRTFEDLARHHAREGFDIWHHRDGELVNRHGLLRLGFRCNQDCWFCWQGRSWPDDVGPARERIDHLHAEGVIALTITGGEPTAFKELPDLLAHARSLGMRVSLQTNAIGFSRPALLARLVEAGVDDAFVSFHSADPDISDAMTRAPGTWVHTVRGIQAALGAGIHVRLNCVVERANVEDLPRHAAFIRDELAPHAERHPLGVSYSHPSRYLDAALYAEHVVPLDEVAGPLAEATRLLEEAGVPVDLLGTCGFPPCVVQDVPGLVERVRRTVFPELHTVSRTDAQACRGCALEARCLGPRKEYLAVHGERGLRPIL